MGENRGGVKAAFFVSRHKMDAKDRAEKLAKRLSAVAGEREILRQAALRDLVALQLADALEVLEQFLKLAQKGHPAAQQTLPAVMAVLALDLPHHRPWGEMTATVKSALLGPLLATDEAMMEFNLLAARKADARNFSDSLGHLKTKARLTRNLDDLAHLAKSFEPSVIRNLLLNARMTETRVVEIAARRPTRPEPLWEVWKSKRWGVCPGVQKALVQNPYASVEMATKIVPLLRRHDWKELDRDNSLHPAVRMLAAQLLESLVPVGTF